MFDMQRYKIPIYAGGEIEYDNTYKTISVYVLENLFCFLPLEVTIEN